MVNNSALPHSWLDRYDDSTWSAAVTELLPTIHRVDQVATRIWFSFFPVKLARALKSTADPAQIAKQFLLGGKYDLKDQIDTSAEFLYGHRYWSPVKAAVREHANLTHKDRELGEQILEVAKQTARRLAIDESLIVGITAVAFMTFQQVGYETFRQAAERPAVPSKWTKSPDQILEERHKEERGGMLKLFRPLNRKFTVTFRENESGGSFQLISMQDLAMAAANDPRDHKSRDPRCIEGPIPVECRSAACGTCWVGILSGTEKLAEPADLEIRRMKDFGYSGFSPDKNSIIRLACQAKCFGNVSIVIPPWNGVIGKLNG